MQITFITTKEPFYLPEFFSFLLENLSKYYQIKVIIVPPVYKGTTPGRLALRYAKTFGLLEALWLSLRVIYNKIMDSFISGKNGHHYSIDSVLKEHGIDFKIAKDINNRQSLDILRNWKSDLIISISCPQIFKQDLIEIPSRGCLNLHGAILPEYRGVMPSFWMLANNEKEAGISLFFINEEIDAGDMLLQRKFPISTDETLDSLIRKSKRIGAEMVLEGIRKIDSGEFSTQPLDLTEGSYYGWPNRQDVLRFLDNGKKFR